ncbi:MAG: zinc ribbon domain-containing protein [Verrucomicrobiae bacterium]|nr:zinc ribbon domain-containing protein [Verrucomicrobiae bacterium]
MPTYQYICTKCNHQFEVFQSMNDEPLRVCPRDKCSQKHWGRGKVKRLVGGGAGFLFKGSGFYITDYRSESYRQAAKKEAEAVSGKKDGGQQPKADSAKTQVSKATESPKTDSGSGLS